MDCRHYEPVKRTYTPEQIAEARDIVYRIMIDKTTFGITYAFERCGNVMYCRTLSSEGAKMWREISCGRADCPDNTEWQDDVMRMKALCKLTGESCPAWLEV
jgi:hypothetical protein